MLTRQKNKVIGITTAAFAFEMDASQGLKAISWQNKLSGETLALGGGAELGVVLDQAKERIWIEGWHFQRTDKAAVGADEESGFLAGYHRPEYPDIDESMQDAARWQRCTGLCPLVVADSHWAWARTRVFLPEAVEGEPLTLTLGGFGVGDFRHTRVFFNGELIGERKPSGAWFEPGTYVLRPEHPAYAKLRFGQVNILALQLGGSINRNARLDAVDPSGAHTWPYPFIIQPPYFQHIEAGENPVRKLSFEVESHAGGQEELRVVLAAREESLRAEILYRSEDSGRTLVKSVTLTNTGAQAVRVMNLGLGDYRTGVEVTEGNMGFPVYADGASFFTLDHPAGWAMGEAGRVRLRQFPGVSIEPEASFACMNAVLGVAEAGRARDAFLAHLTPRMRRVRRGHDRAYSVMDMFGGWPVPPTKIDQFLDDQLTEAICLEHAERLRKFHDKTGESFDLVSVDFWQDPAADLVRFNRHFPDGFDRAKRALTETGPRHGLWIDSSVFAKWHIGRNPLALGCLAGEPSYNIPTDLSKDWAQTVICRAAEPIRTIFKNAFRHHIRQEGARMLKFDNLISVCHSQRHGHWPGVYSTEAIYNSVIGFLEAMDEASPDVFLMLYWGYRSPWWLLHGDMLFECGLMMEAASPSPTPSLYVRDGVALTLDQGTAFSDDVPKLGKDSLGVWLSRWPWNSSIGKERWQEGVVMDLCRGNLLFQPWMGEDALTEAEMRDMAHFMRLLRLRPECFRHSRTILGDPWKNEPYAQVCSDGRRAFVAVNNFAWRDYPLAFDKPAVFGIDLAAGFTVFRHYPEPARLSGTTDCLRPFQVALYELVPAGQAPSSEIAFPNAPAVAAFAEPTVAVAIMARNTSANIGKEDKTVATAGVYDAIKESTDAWRGFAVSGNAPVSQSGGTLVVCAVASRNGKAVPTGSIGSYFKASLTMNGTDTSIAAVLPDKTYPATWQAWRIGVPASAVANPFELTIACRLAADVRLDFQAHYISGSTTRNEYPKANGVVYGQ